MAVCVRINTILHYYHVFPVIDLCACDVRRWLDKCNGANVSLVPVPVPEYTSTKKTLMSHAFWFRK